MTLYTITRDRVAPYEITTNNSGNNLAKNRWVKATKTISFMNRIRLPTKSPSQNFLISRSKKFEAIFLNKCKDKVDIKSVLCCFLGIALGVLFTAFITIYPQHYAIRNSAYWYEPMLVIILSWGPIASIHLINVTLFCMGIEWENTIKTCSIAYGVGSITTCILSYLLYLFWSYVVVLPYPMPFHGYIIAVITWYMMNLVFWFQNLGLRTLALTAHYNCNITGHSCTCTTSEH